MVKNELKTYFQNKINTIINTDYPNYQCTIYDEIDYEFAYPSETRIEANILYGAITKDNDLADKYTMNIVMNIQSELNGYKVASAIFNKVFLNCNRQYATLGEYKAKIILTSPVLTNTYRAEADGYVNWYTMSGTIEFSKSLLVGAVYKLKTTAMTDYVTIKPYQAQNVKDAMGSNDTKISSTIANTFFSKTSETINARFSLLLEYKGDGSNADTLNLALINEAFGVSSTTYSLSVKIGNLDAITLNNLVITQAQYIYDENNGDNVVSLGFARS